MDVMAFLGRHTGNGMVQPYYTSLDGVFSFLSFVPERIRMAQCGRKSGSPLAVVFLAFGISFYDSPSIRRIRSVGHERRGDCEALGVCCGGGTFEMRNMNYVMERLRGVATRG